MPHDGDESRTVLSPRTGTKVSLLIGLALLGVAAYWYFVPVTFLGSNGQFFDCGSASSPPTETFPKNICRDLPDVYRMRAIFSGLIALAVAAIGTALFGFDRRNEVRSVSASRDRLEDGDVRERRSVDEERYDEDRDATEERSFRHSSEDGGSDRYVPRRSRRYDDDSPRR
ncbi:hypothetical protein [Luteipulveratus flavus]|uniref:Transmembrane protein n=1 Tax=Luteipulveratus flavus TaxID=3031728 RepID=A0ABT6C5D9_9MICO|nr:hypothetical protein [Luteipulveratus sp. YIM 133296]MDF8264095.1 hypothetical protein [Luteipulveratus sp. YIM 133296]